MAASPPREAPPASIMRARLLTASVPRGAVAGTIVGCKRSPLHFGSTRDLIAVSEVKFDSPDLSQIKASGKILVHLKDVSKAIDCSYLNCMLNNLTSNITISFGTESVFVDSVCLKKDCSFGVVSHKISTTDTKKIFDVLNSTQILNPLFSIYLYGVVSSGKNTRLGHEINFN